MNLRAIISSAVAIVLLWSFPSSSSAPGCCPAPMKRGDQVMPVVNADQTVIIIWDPATQTEHFIRKASFKTAGNDFGFIIPTPYEPDLDESGNDAFPYLYDVTKPEVKTVPRPANGMGCGCGGGERFNKNAAKASTESHVEVIATKEVAGFHATVLQASSANALVEWLKENGYGFSPEIEAWAKPYVAGGWKFAALKVAASDSGDSNKTVAASALRLSFKTDRPLFPYREPDPKEAAETLGAKRRLLRIYFISNAKFQGELTKEVPWTGKIAWSNYFQDDQRSEILKRLKLPPVTGPKEWWLTEFEDAWPYQAAPGDVYFARSNDQDPVRRKPVEVYARSVWPGDVTIIAIVGVLIVPPLVSRWRKWRLS